MKEQLENIYNSAKNDIEKAQLGFTIQAVWNNVVLNLEYLHINNAVDSDALLFLSDIFTNVNLLMPISLDSAFTVLSVVSINSFTVIIFNPPIYSL